MNRTTEAARHTANLPMGWTILRASGRAFWGRIGAAAVEGTVFIAFMEGGLRDPGSIGLGGVGRSDPARLTRRVRRPARRPRHPRGSRVARVRSHACCPD